MQMRFCKLHTTPLFETYALCVHVIAVPRLARTAVTAAVERAEPFAIDSMMQVAIAMPWPLWKFR